MRSVILGSVMSFIILLAGCASPSADQRKLDAQLRHKQAPDFELTALDGQKVKLGNFRGKPVVLAFFAFG